MKDKRFSSFCQAIERLNEMLTGGKNNTTRDSALLRFAFCFELAWKALADVLRKEGLKCRSPRETFEQGFSCGFISDSALWINMISDRNLVVHTYDELLAEDIYSRLSAYSELFRQLADRIGKTGA